MTLDPTSFEFKLLVTLRVLVIATKLFIALVVGLKVFGKHQKLKEIRNHFLFGIFVLMLSLAISRILYSIFDFRFTLLNPDLVVEYIWWWKAATLVFFIGIVYLLRIIDLTIFRNKLRGIIAWILLIVAIVITVYPVLVYDDFVLISTLALVSAVGAILIPIFFLYVGIKTTGLRRTAFMIAFGMIIFIIGGLIENESIAAMILAIFQFGKNYIYLASTITKIIGLSLFARGSLQFQI
jgi:hypothetical protein